MHRYMQTFEFGLLVDKLDGDVFARLGNVHLLLFMVFNFPLFSIPQGHKVLFLGKGNKITGVVAQSSRNKSFLNLFSGNLRKGNKIGSMERVKRQLF